MLPTQAADQEEHSRKTAQEERRAPPREPACTSAIEPEDQKQNSQRHLHQKAEQENREDVNIHGRPVAPRSSVRRLRPLNHLYGKNAYKSFDPRFLLLGQNQIAARRAF